MEPVDRQHQHPSTLHWTIISGGQTGADREALDFAIEYGLPHGGWCPRGRIAEDGPIPSCYHLQETTSARYPQRTRWNVRDSDATILITLSPHLTGGTKLTAQLAEKLGKPWLHLWRDENEAIESIGARLTQFVIHHKARRINIAGPRHSNSPDIGPFVRDTLTAALKHAET